MKQPDPDAISEDELRRVLGLYQTTGKGTKVPLESIRPIEVSHLPTRLRLKYSDSLDQGLHVQRCPATGLRRGYSLAQPVCVIEIYEDGRDDVK
jgi:hypothetical protein